MTHHEIVKRLTGKINPIGETNTDNERFDNLKTLCDLVNNLVIDIDDMVFSNKDAVEFSVKRAADYGRDFLTNKLGIKP